ncbi:MAG TPA: sortase [Candidatus Saccharimonadales bacterium]|nr:sortase [Candidatus Saccharimonadales bacterium]
MKRSAKTTKPTVGKKPAVKPAKKPVLRAAAKPARKAIAKTPVAPAKKAAKKQAKQAANAAAKQTKPAKVTHPKATITFRHNFLPPIMGVLMFLGVLGFLNGQWVVAQMQYHFTPLHTKSRGTVPPLSLDPKAQPRLIIPSVGIDVPYITTESSYDVDKVQTALRGGVVHFGTTALPGQIGNMVIIGHSSEAIWAPGHYKYAFTLLNKVPEKALVYIDYRGARYIYRITSSEVVEPEDVGVLDQSTDTPDLTLITCTPVGVSTHRLVLHGVQISPAPSTATRADVPAGIGSATALPR